MLGFCSSVKFSFFFSFLFFLTLIFNFLNLLFFYTYSFVCFFYCSLPLAVNLMYINLHLPLFNFAYLFFLSFLFFLSSQYICQFCFHCFIPHLTPCFSFVFQFSLQLILFLTGKYNFLFPLFTRSIHCTLFLLDCFDFAHGCICICVYYITLIVVCLIL